MKQLVIVFIFSILSFINSTAQKSSSIFDWSYEQEIPNKIGLNGSFMGIHNDALIIAVLVMP